MSFDEFIIDKKSKDAVIRNFEIIGEAGNRLPVDFIISNPQIDWNRIRGLRNRIVHDYFGIDFSIIWNIKENYLPILLAELKEINAEKNEF
ncbi:MAG: HepT-like ribonuclease domain-containing protein [Saprospiraceae bacterium]